MGNFNRSFNRDRGSGGGGRGFDNSRRDREMHSTTCSNCGRECQVPFKPNGSKPVFCSDCFEKNGGETRRSNDRDYAPRRPNFEDRRPDFSRNRDERPQNFARPQYNDKPQSNDQFASLNSKLDKIIELLSRKPQESTNLKTITEPAAEHEIPAPVSEKKKRAPKKNAPKQAAE